MLQFKLYGCIVVLKKGCDWLKEIETIRNELNLTQPEFAQEINISLRSYLNKINNEQEWKLNELIKISNLCKDEIKIKNGMNTYLISIKKI